MMVMREIVLPKKLGLEVKCKNLNDLKLEKQDIPNMKQREFAAS